MGIVGGLIGGRLVFHFTHVSCTKLNTCLDSLVASSTAKSQKVDKMMMVTYRLTAYLLL